MDNIKRMVEDADQMIQRGWSGQIPQESQSAWPKQPEVPTNWGTRMPGRESAAWESWPSEREASAWGSQPPEMEASTWGSQPPEMGPSAWGSQPPETGQGVWPDQTLGAEQTDWSVYQEWNGQNNRSNQEEQTKQTQVYEPGQLAWPDRIPEERRRAWMGQELSESWGDSKDGIQASGEGIMEQPLEERDLDPALDIDFRGILTEEPESQEEDLLAADQAGTKRQITGKMSIEDILAEWERTKEAAQAALQEAEQKKLENAKVKALREAEKLVERLMAEVHLETGMGGQQEPVSEGARSSMPEDPGMGSGDSMQDSRIPKGSPGVDADGRFPENETTIEEESSRLPESETTLGEESSRFPEREMTPGEENFRTEEEPLRGESFSEETDRKKNLKGEPEPVQEKDLRGEQEPVQEKVLKGEPEVAVEKEPGKESEAAVGEDTQEEPPEALILKKQKELEESILKRQQMVQQVLEREVREEQMLQREVTVDASFDEEPPITQLNEEQKRIFTYFTCISGMEQQLCQALEGARQRKRNHRTSRSGNLAIIGGKRSGKTTLATDFVKAYQKLEGHTGGKVGKISAETLNQKDVSVLCKAVEGGYLIIEKAGGLSKESVDKLSLLMEQDTGGMMVILEDEKAGIKKTLARNPEFTKKFTEKISVPIFTSDELVSFAKAYAGEHDCEIEDMGILALYNSISSIQKLDEATTLTEVKEIMDEAIARASRGGLKKLFGGKRSSENGRVLIKEKDFREY